MGGYDKSALQQATAASKQILQFHYNREFTTPKQAPPAGLLYHYTTADGLKGIIETNELWATSAYFLNDSGEITYGYGLLKEVLDDWLAKNQRPEESLTLGIARGLRKWFGEDLLDRKIIDPIYLACFCEEDNLLSQWRAYGQSGGYSLGFQVPARDPRTGQGFKPEPNIYTAEWVKVVYDRDKHAKKCSAILDPVFTIFDDPDTAQSILAVGDHPIVGYSAILRLVADMLLEEIVGFKSEAFKVEKEWRVVVRRRALTKQGNDDGGKTPIPVYFWSSKGTLVPYIKLIPNDPNKKLPVASVRSGPTFDKTTAGMALAMLLQRNSFRSVRVYGSDIPARFECGSEAVSWQR